MRRAALLLLAACGAAGNTGEWLLTGGAARACADAGWTAASLFAYAAMLGALGRCRQEERRIWLALAISTGAWFVAQVIWEAYDLFGRVAPTPGPADVIWLAVPVIAAVGLYRLAPAPPRIRWLLDLDASVLALTVGAFVLAFEWRAIVASDLSYAGRATTIAYPVTYSAAVAVALGAIIGAPSVMRRLDLMLVFLGIAIEGAAFAAWARQLLDATYDPGASLLDIAFCAGLLALGAGALRVRHDAPAVEAEPRPLRRRTAITGVGFLALIAMLAYLAVTGQDLTPRLVVLGALAVTGLLIFPRNWFAFSVVEQLERERLAALNRRNRELEAFAYSASHDLKAPLVSIDGFAGLLERSLAGQLDERSRGYLERIHANAQNMQNLISDLFAFARNGADDGPVDAVDTTVLAHSLVDEWRDRAEAAGASLAVEGLLPAVHAHPVRLRQALTNLIDNAIRYGGSDVRVSGRLVEDRAEILVDDGGQGVAPEDREAIFEAFSRGRGAVASSPDGTGLGLALVKRNVEASGGSVRYEDTHGARFVLSFPKGGA